jgi:hypothetical protein
VVSCTLHPGLQFFAALHFRNSLQFLSKTWKIFNVKASLSTQSYCKSTFGHMPNIEGVLNLGIVVPQKTSDLPM